MQLLTNKSDKQLGSGINVSINLHAHDIRFQKQFTLIANYHTGFAYVGGACVVNKRLEKVNSVAIIEDTGGFSGIIVAAHEVGHL